ncbi:MAG: acetate kinase [Candidatus Brocadiales bacterium]|nr:acetate kinase [Candidatus Brocadiales bacterium]
MNRKRDLKVLVINCGSSSVKFQLINMADENVLASGIAERIELPQSLIKFKFGNKSFTKEFDSLDHSSAISEILDSVTHGQLGVIDGKSEISAVGHRVVHGAEHFTESVLITDDTIKQIENCIDLAPLHNPHNLKGILVCKQLLSGIPQVAVFDTAFHHTMEDHVYTYALAYRFYEKYRFRRYGFHGTSHFYVAHRAAEIVGKDIQGLKIITCHLGNGASIAAVKHGKSIDTSMGFTPLEGLVMGTRCGDVDPAMVLFIMEKEGLSPHECDMLMNHECGLLGVSGISSDMRDLLKAFQEGNDRARLALQMYTYRIRKYIGMYSASMNGVDLIVFTGGVGENAILIRNMCCTDMEYLGINFDEEKNKKTIGIEGELTAQNSKVRVLCVPTNEELVIARDTARIIDN